MKDKATTFRDDTFETLRRMAYGVCECCGEDYEAHDKRAQSQCGIDCDHCHESDFKCASDDPTLLGREQLKLIYDCLPAAIRNRTRTAEVEP